MLKSKNAVIIVIKLTCLSLLFCAHSFSNNSSEEESKATRSFGLSGSIETSSSLHSFEDHRHQASLTGSLSPGYKLTEKIKMTGVISASRDLVAKYPENELSNPKLSLSYTTRLNPYLVFRPLIAGVYALNEASVKRDSYIGSVQFEPRISLDLARIGLSDLGLMYQFGISKNFHEFTVNRVGTSNTEYLMSNTLALGYQILEPLSISLIGVLSTGLTYDTRSPKNSFTLAQELSYQVIEQVSLSISHANGGAAYKENGVDTNISLIDENASMVAAGLTLTL